MLCVLLGTSGCTIEPTKVDTAAVRERFSNWALPSVNEASPLDFVPYVADDAQRWWEVFEDPVLTALVEDAQENSFDVKVAIASVRQAQALARASRADLLPTLGLDAQVSNEQPDLPTDGLTRSTSISAGSVALGADWQVDLFKQLKTSAQAAEARAGSAAALLRDLKRVITMQTVATYVQLRNFQARVRLSADSARRRVQNIERAQSLLDRSFGTVLDLKRSENQLYQSRAESTALTNGVVQLSNQLAVLTVQPLQDVRDLIGPPPQFTAPPDTVPFPSVDQLLTHRPDLRSSEQELFAAALDVDSSKAALYPNLGLRAELFSDVTTLDRLLPPFSLLSGRILGNLALPLLGRGRLLAAVDVNTANLDAALANYDGAVLGVVSEVDTALDGLFRSREIHADRIRAATAAREAAEASRELFLAGEVDYVSVVVAEQTRATAEDLALTAERDAILAYVNYVSAVAPAW